MTMPHWRYPHCHWPLMLDGRQFHCVGGHAFDQAKEGYVNLLPVNRKHSAAPGDDIHMLRSRREFLDQGHYRPLADLLAGLCLEQLRQAPEKPFRVLDVGCGEGYYTDAVFTALRDAASPGEIHAGGIDIARDAARLASRRYPDISFAVASNADLPVPDASVDCILRVFAPEANAETLRVLKPGGLFISVIPGERHLFGLRERVYAQAREHAAQVPVIDGLRHLRRESLDYPKFLS